MLYPSRCLLSSSHINHVAKFGAFVVGWLVGSRSPVGRYTMQGGAFSAGPVGQNDQHSKKLKKILRILGINVFAIGNVQI
jgi:hypothetical protein